MKRPEISPKRILFLSWSLILRSFSLSISSIIVFFLDKLEAFPN